MAGMAAASRWSGSAMNQAGRSRSTVEVRNSGGGFCLQGPFGARESPLLVMPANHRSAVDTCEYAQSSGQGQPNKCDHDALPRSMSFDDRKSALLGFGPRCAGAHGQPSGTVFGSGMRSVTAGGTLRDRAWMPIDRASSARCRPGR